MQEKQGSPERLQVKKDRFSFKNSYSEKKIFAEETEHSENKSVFFFQVPLKNIHAKKIKSFRLVVRSDGVERFTTYEK